MCDYYLAFFLRLNEGNTFVTLMFDDTTLPQLFIAIDVIHPLSLLIINIFFIFHVFFTKCFTPLKLEP